MAIETCGGPPVAILRAMNEPTDARAVPTTLSRGARAAPPLLLALGLSLGPLLSLGLARFAYALLLPSMRRDLALSFAAAGALNTANALGYLVGALGGVGLARRFGTRDVLRAGCLITVMMLAASGATLQLPLLLLLRFGMGVGSALVFSLGGLLAARLAGAHPERAGLLLGCYYGGTGAGILLAAWLLPPVLALPLAHPWQAAWLLLAALAAIATLLLWRPSGLLAAPLPRAAGGWPLRAFPLALAGYFCFGVGYIGYMTFNVALLQQHGATPAQVTLFFSLIGLGVLAAPRLWARLLDRARGGRAIGLLNGLVALATVLPVTSDRLGVALLSGALFGCCFLSVVAATTALVRHRLAPGEWAAGIGLFTSIFALGQVVGPVLTGWLSDGGGLGRGLLGSGAVLLLGAALALGEGRGSTA
jgi:predicted MFS family arabinose efflux permease